MWKVCALAAAALLVLGGCSGDAGDEGAFDGDPIEGGADAGPATTSDGDEADEPQRVELDPEEPDGEQRSGTTTVPDDPAAPGVTVLGPTGDEITSFRDGLEQGGLPGEQVECFVAAASESLGMTEAEMDRLVVEDPANGWLVAASQAAATECLADGLPALTGPGGIVLPDDVGATLTEQLAGLGMTPDEADCISDLYADTGTAAEAKDFLVCIPLERLIELAG